MTNIALVLAVSEYIHEKPLPACAKDGEAIAQILRATGKFDEVLVLTTSTETEGATTKEKISELADRYRTTPIEELFFYFSGHGSFSGDDLYLLLRDYNDREKKQTSLQNSELDGIIRALNPSLYVKIIDACESGVSYIKSGDNIGDYLKSTSAGLRGVYFMFSSQSDENSYASPEISYFTKSIVNSIANHKARTIRYKDIINTVSDDFDAASMQTPFFVMQANMTEPFTEITDTVRKSALSALGLPTTPSTKPKRDKTQPIQSIAVASLADQIRSAAEKIASRSEAEAALMRIAEQFKGIPLSAETKEFYSEIHEKRDSRPTGTKAIGEWLSNNEDRGFFANCNKKREQYQKRVPKMGLFATSSSINRMLGRDDENDYQMVTAYRDIVTGYSLTASLPYEELVIRLEPNIGVLTPEECGVLPIVSRSHIRLFWSFTHFEYTDWDVAVARTRTDWLSDEAPLKDQSALDDLALRIKSAFAKNVDASLHAKWTAQMPTLIQLSDARPAEATGKVKPS